MQIYKVGAAKTKQNKTHLSAVNLRFPQIF